MKRFTILIVSLVLPLVAIAASADKSEHQGHKADAPKTITGEVVDTGCYLAHGAKGAKHIECATKCISQGMPMGLLTSDNTLYLLTLSHDDADPYNKLKDMAGKTVSVTGPVMSRSGIKGLEVTSFKAAGAPAAK